MTAAPSLPLYLTGSFLTKHYNAGIPGGVDSVFDALANPPTTGVAAQEANESAAQAVGIDISDSPARLNVNRQRDGIKDFYDSASILRVPVEET